MTCRLINAQDICRPPRGTYPGDSYSPVLCRPVILQLITCEQTRASSLRRLYAESGRAWARLARPRLQSARGSPERLLHRPGLWTTGDTPTFIVGSFGDLRSFITAAKQSWSRPRWVSSASSCLGTPAAVTLRVTQTLPSGEDITQEKRRESHTKSSDPS